MILDLFGSKKREPAACLIKLSGEEITDLYPFLTEVTVHSSRTQAAEATLTFETRRHEENTWVVQDDRRLKPWAKVQIEAQFGHEGEEVMRGYVREVRADYPNEAGTATVTVTCQDESLPLDREHIRRSWGADGATTDRVMLKEIVVRRHGLKLRPDCADGLSNLVVLQDTTNAHFLRQRADANGYEFWFREGEVYFGPMRLTARVQDTIIVYAGLSTNCLNISIEDDGHRPDRVAYEIAAEVGAESEVAEVQPDLPLLGTEPADSSDVGLRDFTWRMTRQGVSNPEQMTARAQFRANEQSMKVRATGELDGSLYGHVLRFAEPVGVDGIGDRYGGIYYVDAVDHRFDMNGYRQSFTLLRNAYGDNLETGVSRLSTLL